MWEFLQNLPKCLFGKNMNPLATCVDYAAIARCLHQQHHHQYWGDTIIHAHNFSGELNLLPLAAMFLSPACPAPTPPPRLPSPAPGGGVDARERLLIGQQQALVRREEVGGPHQRVVGRQPAGSHEAKRLVHTARQLLVPAGVMG